MKAHSKTIVICGGARTPVGHISRSLADIDAPNLMQLAVEAAIEKTRLPKDAVDGLFAGWVAQDIVAPNLARVASLRCGFPEKAHAMTMQCNCISSVEAVAMAGRAILCGEGDVYVAGGVESMSRMPYEIVGSRAEKELRSMATLKANWATLLDRETITVHDSIEQGLTDPTRGINMAATAEICAQMHGISRPAQDEYAHQSFKRTLDSWARGFYSSHVVPVSGKGQTVLDKDEYPFLREDLVAKPQKFAKAPTLFDGSSYTIRDFYRDFGSRMDGKAYAEGVRGTVSLFNSCGRSDGAAAVVVASEDRAKSLGLPILAEIRGWGFYGNDPAYMGVSPALAAPLALERSGIAFSDLDQIELHEPFAATVLGVFKLGKERFGHDWEGKYRDGALNPNGGSIALGHPLGATGARLLLNLLHALRENPKGRFGMLAAGAGGGIGGALAIERRD